MERLELLGELRATIESGNAVLFTGAGFSADALDVAGRHIPGTAEMVHELWSLVFDGEPDDSSLADIYDVALAAAPRELADYLDRRFRVAPASLPAHYERWFSAPWRAIYTLNVDDLEGAVQRRYPLPRRLRSCSAVRPGSDRAADGEVAVVHLNGLVGDDPRELTFSTLQYAARLCSEDRVYMRLAAELEELPFIFTGTTLDEVILWQEVERQRRARGRRRERASSYVISTSLSRARQALLEGLSIRWVPMSTAEVAARIL